MLVRVALSSSLCLIVIFLLLNLVFEALYHFPPLGDNSP